MPTRNFLCSSLFCDNTVDHFEFADRIKVSRRFSKEDMFKVGSVHFSNLDLRFLNTYF